MCSSDLAKLLELDLLVGQISLAGKGFGGHLCLLTLVFAKNWIVVGILLCVFAPAKRGANLPTPNPLNEAK